MKVIDLIVAISKGEELPKKIMFIGCRYTWDDDFYRYINEDFKEELHYLTDDINIFACINDEIEIIEDTPKKIEKIKTLNNVGNCQNLIEFKDKQQLSNHILKDKLNEIIDYINNMEK